MIILGIMFALAFLGVIGNYFVIASDPKYSEAAAEQQKITISAGAASGNIYDRNMQLLVNEETDYIAVVVPQSVERTEIAKFVTDKAEFQEKFDMGEPFTVKLSGYADESDGLTIFQLPVRYSENQLAQHIIGYTSQGSGVTGIESAYNRILRSVDNENSVTYTADGFGRILIGDGKNVTRSSIVCSGIVTTIDRDIQQIVEDCWVVEKCGAVVVSEVKTGDILALASFPDYSTYALGEAMNDENSPMINRALYSYSVGSIFKLVTACEGIQQDFSGYMYECTGSIKVNGKTFRCHKHDGHGLQTMSDAMVNSCNTYFISLSELFTPEEFRETAFTLGFGREIHLCSGITSSGGVLPTVADLKIPAELANFSFGQGKLAATPLQISQLTCAIANDGKMPMMRLIRGITRDGYSVSNEKSPRLTYAMEPDVARQLKQMMLSAVKNNENSNARSYYVETAAKTSTAQTGQSDENGEELCHSWITGYFPADNPKYAITVLVEDGGYGNDAAAPIFRKIADEISLQKDTA